MMRKGKKTCPACLGTGVQHNTKKGITETCPVCLGTGTVSKDFGKEEKKDYFGSKGNSKPIKYLK